MAATKKVDTPLADIALAPMDGDEPAADPPPDMPIGDPPLSDEPAMPEEPPLPVVPSVPTSWDEMKAWIRWEMELFARGHGEEERDKMNP